MWWKDRKDDSEATYRREGHGGTGKTTWVVWRGMGVRDAYKGKVKCQKVTARGLSVQIRMRPGVDRLCSAQSASMNGKPFFFLFLFPLSSVLDFGPRP